MTDISDIMNSNLFKIALMILMIALVLIAFIPQLRSLVRSPEEFQEKYRPSQEEISAVETSFDLGFTIDDSGLVEDRIKSIVNNLDNLAYQEIDHGIVYTPIYIKVKNPDCSNLKSNIAKGLGNTMGSAYQDTSLYFDSGCWNPDFNSYDYSYVYNQVFRWKRGDFNCDANGVTILLRIGKYIDISSGHETYLYAFCVKPE